MLTVPTSLLRGTPIIAAITASSAALAVDRRGGQGLGRGETMTAR